MFSMWLIIYTYIIMYLKKIKLESSQYTQILVKTTISIKENI